MVILNAPFKSTGCHEYNLSDFSEGEFLPEKYGGETFLTDAGQRSRAIGDQQPPERRGLYPDPDAVRLTLARSASTNRYCP